MKEYQLKSFNLPKNTKNKEIISSKLDTLPKFLVIKGNRVVNILEYLKETKDSLKKVLINLKKLNFNDKNEIAILFFTFNKSIKNILKMSEQQGINSSFIISHKLTENDIVISDIFNIINKKEQEISDQIKNIKDNLKKVVTNKVKAGKLVKEIIEVICIFDKYNLDTIFNQIKLNSNIIPFIIYERGENTFFKIYKDFTPDDYIYTWNKKEDNMWKQMLELWVQFLEKYDRFPQKNIFLNNNEEYEEQLYKWMITQQRLFQDQKLKFLEKYSLLQSNFPLVKNVSKSSSSKIILKYLDYKEYKDIEISINPDNNLIIKFKSKDDKNRDMIITNISKVFSSIKLKISNIEENIITSSVIFKLEKTYNKYILLDLISNNKAFSKHICVNEFDKVDKKKDTTIWVYFKNNTNIPCNYGTTLTITSVKDDDKIVSIKIKKSTEIQIKKIINTMTTLFTIYLDKREEIIRFYRKYISNFPKQKKIIVKKHKQGVKKLDRELFPNFIYARSCQGKFQPILNYKDSDKLDPERTILFPLGDKNKPVQRYTCVNKLYPWPGLKKMVGEGIDKEKIDNHPTYGYVPCCYKTNKKYRLYQEYKDNGINILKNKNNSNKKQTNIEETNHFITKGDKKKFNSFENLGKGNYFRKGFATKKSEANINSFLYCIYYIFETSNLVSEMFKKLDYKKLDKFFNDKRIEFSKDKELIACCKQELYDKTSEEISDILANEKEFFNPKLFINLLSNKFSCNIFLFEKIDNKIELVLPRHTMGYYHNLDNANCVLLYLNYGSKSSKNAIPQCEIIGFSNNKNRLEIVFERDSNIAKQRGVPDIYKIVNSIFNTLTNNIILTKPKQFTTQIFNIKQKYFKNQSFDIYGKSRILTFKLNETLGTLIVSPIQPITIKEAESIKILKVIKNLAEDFFKNIIEIQDFNHILSSDKEIIAITASENNITYTIPIISEKNIYKSNPIMSQFNIPKNNSYLTNFNKYDKLSRYLKSYILWIYSRSKKDIEIKYDFDITKSVEDFGKNYIKIKKNYSYEKINIKFIEKSSLLENGKLIVDSKETRKRLLYYLFINIKNNENKLFNYYKKVYIPDYYKNISDFDKYLTEILLEGIDSFKNWFESDKEFELYNKIKPELEEIYFLSNYNIDNGLIFLAQNTYTWDEALEIATIWNKDKYIPNYDELRNNDIEANFTLYSYENKNNIEKYIIGKGNKNINIAGYKVDNQAQYTVLLKI